MIELHPISVTDESTGAVLDAIVARCCDQDRFNVFQIDGQDHPHLQCIVCRASYCPAGKCTLLKR